MIMKKITVFEKMSHIMNFRAKNSKNSMFTNLYIDFWHEHSTIFTLRNNQSYETQPLHYKDLIVDESLAVTVSVIDILDIFIR